MPPRRVGWNCPTAPDAGIADKVDDMHHFAMADVFVREKEDLAFVALARVAGKLPLQGVVIGANDIADVVEERKGFLVVRLEEDEAGSGLRAFLKGGRGKGEVDAFVDDHAPGEGGAEGGDDDGVEPGDNLKEEPPEASVAAKSRADAGAAPGKPLLGMGSASLHSPPPRHRRRAGSIST